MALRRLISLTLVALLLMTSQSMAALRGASEATGHFVICSGTQTQIIYVDASGAPTVAPHFCPDCALADIAGTAPPRLVAPSTLRATYLSRGWHTSVHVLPVDRANHSRAPPVLI